VGRIYSSVLAAKADSLWREVKEAERVRDEHLSKLQDLKDAYVGPAWGTSTVGDPENSSFEFVTLWVPRAVAGDPKVKIGTSRKGSQRKVAQALSHAVNRQIRDTRISKTLELWAVDFAFCWCAALTTLEETSLYTQEFDDPVLGPRSYRIDPRHFFWDVQAMSRDECRYMGHDFPKDIEDLKREARDNPDEGWRMKAIQQLADQMQEEADRSSKVNRGEAIIREVWVGELDIETLEGGKWASEDQSPEDGYHGVIFTLDRNGEFLRDPRGFYGPRTGPYTFWGAYDVPGEPAPLSVLMATDQQRQDLNRHVRANNRAHDRRKRIAIFDKKMGSDARTLKNAQDGDWVGIQGFDKDRFAESETGGVTDQGMLAEGTKRDRLHRMQGISDAKAGNPQRGVTATADAIADEADTTRTQFLQGRFQAGPREIFSKWAWYDYHDEEVVVQMPDEAQAEGLEPWFYGGSGAKGFLAALQRQNPNLKVTEDQLKELFPGIEEEGSGATFDDLELEIEFYSMARMSQAQQMRQASMLLDLAAKSAPMIMQNPHVDWPALYDFMGQTVGLPSLGDIINPRLAFNLFGLQMALQAQDQMPSEGDGPQITRNQGLYGSVNAQAGRRSQADMQGQQAGAMAGAQAGAA